MAVAKALSLTPRTKQHREVLSLIRKHQSRRGFVSTTTAMMELVRIGAEAAEKQQDRQAKSAPPVPSPSDPSNP
jgi:lysyl-tRNA synthetase class II